MSQRTAGPPVVGEVMNAHARTVRPPRSFSRQISSGPCPAVDRAAHARVHTAVGPQIGLEGEVSIRPVTVLGSAPRAERRERGDGGDHFEETTREPALCRRISPASTAAARGQRRQQHAAPLGRRRVEGVEARRVRHVHRCRDGSRRRKRGSSATNRRCCAASSHDDRSRVANRAVLRGDFVEFTAVVARKPSTW